MKPLTSVRGSAPPKRPKPRHLSSRAIRANSLRPPALARAPLCAALSAAAVRCAPRHVCDNHSDLTLSANWTPPSSRPSWWLVQLAHSVPFSPASSTKARLRSVPPACHAASAVTKFRRQGLPLTIAKARLWQAPLQTCTTCSPRSKAASLSKLLRTTAKNKCRGDVHDSFALRCRDQRGQLCPVAVVYRASPNEHTSPPLSNAKLRFHHAATFPPAASRSSLAAPVHASASQCSSFGQPYGTILATCFPSESEEVSPGDSIPKSCTSPSNPGYARPSHSTKSSAPCATQAKRHQSKVAVGDVLASLAFSMGCGLSRRTWPHQIPGAGPATLRLECRGAL